MNGILCTKSRTEYCDCMSTYLSPGILKIKWVHPRYMYVSVRLQLTEDGERYGATEGSLASSFYTPRFSIFPSFLWKKSAEEFGQIIISVPVISETTKNQTESFHGVLVRSENWCIQKTAIKHCGINVECKIELRIVQPTVSRKRIHS